MHSFSPIINDASNDDKLTISSTTPSTNPKRIQLIVKSNPFTKQSPMNCNTNMILVNSSEQKHEEESQNETVIKLLESNSNFTEHNQHDFMTNKLSLNVCSQRKQKRNDDSLIQATCNQNSKKNNIKIVNENVDINQTLSDLEIINILNKFMFIMFLVFISLLNFFCLFFFPYFVYEPISIEKEF